MPKNKFCGTFLTQYCRGKITPMPVRNDGSGCSRTLAHDPAVITGSGEMRMTLPL